MRLVRRTPYGVLLSVALAFTVGSALVPPVTARAVVLPKLSVNQSRMQATGEISVHKLLTLDSRGSAPRHVIQATNRVARHAPVVVFEPRSSTVRVGRSAVFTARSRATPRARVTWLLRRPGAHRYGLIRGATANVLRLNKVTLSQNGSRFEAVFTNALGHVHTTSAVLRVLTSVVPTTQRPTPAPSLAPLVAPTVTLNPQDVSISSGATATFFASASGAPAPSVQWEVSSDAGVIFAPLAGATSNTLSVMNVATAMNAQEYEAVFTNSVGTVTSTVATLRVASLTPNLQSSSNWAGYVAAPGTFTSVSATWTVPTASCTSASTYSSVWVGIDGYQSPSVEQDGTEADCANGVVSYNAWYEMYGNTNPQCNCYSSVPVNNRVAAGDVVTGTVQELSGTWKMTLSDATQGWTFSTTASSPTPVPAQSSAEWIFERPELCSTSSCSSTTLTTLTAQSPVVFTNATAATASSSPSAISAFSSVALQMVDSSTPLATPSILDPSGTSFSVHE